MSVPDQRHCFNVAYTAQQLAACSSGLRLRLLTRAALLHDVGRLNNDLSTAVKVLAVLFSAAFPVRARQWADGKLRRTHCIVARFHHGLFVYYHHGAIGAKRLQQLGSEAELIKMVARHHQLGADDDSAELALLRQADQMN
jgi:putative nucleotidyltransferase with HDIG domain